MNSAQRKHYQTLLKEQLAEISKSAELHQRQIEESHETSDFVGVDRAAELETMEVDSSITASEINLVKKIEHALTRIQDGSYGSCETCGEEIPTARLDAKPSVSLCVPCQEKHEAEGR